MTDEKKFNWKLKDILMIAIAGVLFSFLYLATDYLGLAISTALTPSGWGVIGYEPAYGIYFMAAAFAVYVIQKPGVGIVAEVIAATLEVLEGNWFGPSVILTGLVQGAAIELAFAIWRYKKFTWNQMVLASFTVTFISYAYNLWSAQYYLLTPNVITVMVIIRLVSSLVFTTCVTKLLADGLAKTGVLNAYALGQVNAKKKAFEVEEDADEEAENGLEVGKNK